MGHRYSDKALALYFYVCQGINRSSALHIKTGITPEEVHFILMDMRRKKLIRHNKKYGWRPVPIENLNT